MVGTLVFCLQLSAVRGHHISARVTESTTAHVEVAVHLLKAVRAFSGVASDPNRYSAEAAAPSGPC
jgi:hypothetical protein